MAILHNPATGDDEPLGDDEPRLCPIHGNEVEPNGFCDACWRAHYEQSLTWDADDEADARFDRSRED